MDERERTGPNAGQIEYWNDAAGHKWVRLQSMLDTQLEDLGHAAMDAAEIGAGDAILDVGCGCGTTSTEIGRRVGSTGRVLGVDLSAEMLERAAAVAGDAGVAHVRFEQADAQTHDFEAEAFDALYSRFGVMFFADPTAAFANLRRALRPGGRLTFVCWQAVSANPWMLLPMMAAMQHVQLDVPPDPEAPGPFAFADASRVERILGGAGFDEVRCESLESPLALGGGAGVDQAVDFMLEIGPVSRLTADLDDGTRGAVASAIREALAPYDGPGGVRMPAAAWLVRARRA